MTTLNIDHYEKLAQIFLFPKSGYRDKIKEAEIVIKKHCPESYSTFKQFSDFVNSCSFDEVTEIFTRTFDVQAITTLDIGYVLFGDDYKRGELLVNLNREHREAGNECNGELADNLSNLLTLLSKMKNHDIRNDLVEIIIMPGLNKIIKEFDSKNIVIKNKAYQKEYKTVLEQSKDYGKIFLVPLEIVNKIIEKDFGNAKPKKDDDNDFTKSITKEIELD